MSIHLALQHLSIKSAETNLYTFRYRLLSVSLQICFCTLYRKDSIKFTIHCIKMQQYIYYRGRLILELLSQFPLDGLTVYLGSLSNLHLFLLLKSCQICTFFVKSRLLSPLKSCQICTLFHNKIV